MVLIRDIACNNKWFCEKENQLALICDVGIVFLFINKFTKFIKAWVTQKWVMSKLLLKDFMLYLLVEWILLKNKDPKFIEPEIMKKNLLLL